MEAERASRTSPNPVPTRRIAQLALPALVVLAAEPLYVLVDTAVVGRPGAVSLAAVTIGGTVMSVAAWLGIVAAYGTTGRAVRRFGAGDRRAAIAEGVQASWLALVAGVLLAAAGNGWMRGSRRPGVRSGTSWRPTRSPPYSARSWSMLIRLVGLTLRLRSPRWAVLGAAVGRA